VIIDSSAIIAIARREPGHEQLLSKLAAATRRGVGSPTLLEVGIVLRARLEIDPTPSSIAFCATSSSTWFPSASRTGARP
jgi:uncharacterized protein with PIN domain